MQLRIKVKTSSKKFAINCKNGIVIHATQKPLHNKVNVEIVTELTKVFNRRVWIKAGMKSRDKIIEVDGSEEEIIEKLRKFC